MGFVLAMEQRTSSTLSAAFLKGAWEFTKQIHMCLVDLERVSMTLSLLVRCGGFFSSKELESLIGAIWFLYRQGMSLVGIAGI